MERCNAIIIGAGPSGIAMSHTLKHKLGFHDFEVYEKLDGLGGTWRTNTYPGCGCDVPSHLYSFSFNLNPDWSKQLCDQEEILAYMDSTADKFNLRSHFRFNYACISARWNIETQQWDVTFQHTTTKDRFTKSASILISAVGGISEPRNIQFPGMEEFKGEMFHTARWNHGYRWRGKRMAVIGNGCSAAQVVPALAKHARQVTQFARSQQWYHERPNRDFTMFEKFCFRWLPFWQRYLRLKLFLESDKLVTTYGNSPKSIARRREVEESAKSYIYKTTPKKYHDVIIPGFPLGCKRRIFDPNYLESLHANNVTLVPEGIKSFDVTGITSSSGRHEDFDAIVFATGFQVTNFLTPIQVIGKTGDTLEAQWAAGRGAQAYLGSFIHNFPNFAIIFGPNTFPAHNSVIFTSEVQVEYIAKTLFRPIMDKAATVIEVKDIAEQDFANRVDEDLRGSVFAAGCTNWYINTKGRNSASWPGKAADFWKATSTPRWSDFILTGGDKPTWVLRSLKRKVFEVASWSWPAVLGLGAFVMLMRHSLF